MPDLVRDLVGLGVRVHAVEPVRISLEERLLAVLRHEEPGREDGTMTALTIAGLTLREAFRRRVVWALLALTVGPARPQRLGLLEAVGLDTELGTMTSGEARLVASLLLNLIMFGMSLIAAIGTAFLAGPSWPERWSRGRPWRCSPARCAARPSCSASGWASVTFGCGYMVVAGFAQILVVRARWATGHPHRPWARAARGRNGGADDAGPPAVQRRLADGVGHRRGRAVRRDVVAGVVGGIGGALGNEGISAWGPCRGSCCPPTACGAGP